MEEQLMISISERSSMLKAQKLKRHGVFEDIGMTAEDCAID